MLVLKLWNYMRGYVIVKVEGLALERFINMCIARGIYLWDIKRINYTTLEAKIGIQGFKELRKIVKRAGCRVSIHKKNGYPFWVHKLKKRKMLLVGAFFCFLILVFSSTFIFSIEIIGNEELEKSEIISSLNELGLKPGTNKYLVNLKEIETELLLDVDQIAWVGIEVRGIRAKVEIVEKRLAPDKIDKNTPCNVIAKKNGVIEKVIARNGDAVVEEGDIVTKGDLLINGVVQRENMDEPMFVHSYGEIYAKTYYETTESKNLIEIKKDKTGQKFKKRTFNLGSIELSFNKGDIPYDVYIVEKKSKRPFQWRNIGLPVEIITEDYYEAIQFEERIDEIQAKNHIHKEAINKLLKDIPLDAKILNTQIDFTIQDDILYGKVIIEVLENIAEQKTLQIGED
ncbi:sporulation protein YqfD [Alkaliphilus sp. MSJ-5]|uniref:Sporulation protein YqfD n=1 Tax=Alkaliphilus flagellatus TaxID=2841507 RepID=A0ABS6G025_9FIRM|nr:sporulation protein YqfD [Alkaliphilus flagellatus]MBU5675674.1 sporulation protein YqfD [Alkaliphilus flagellatus]